MDRLENSEQYEKNGVDLDDLIEFETNNDHLRKNSLSINRNRINKEKERKEKEKERAYLSAETTKMERIKEIENLKKENYNLNSIFYIDKSNILSSLNLMKFFFCLSFLCNIFMLFFILKKKRTIEKKKNKKIVTGVSRGRIQKKKK